MLTLFGAPECLMNQTNPYKRLASVYEPLETLYSGGAISRSKRDHLTHVRPGDQVGFIGVGAGEDARAALRLGASVTAIDQSPGMLRRTERRLKGTGEKNWRTILTDVMDYQGPAFDLVVAHFFLNIFEGAALKRMIQHLSQLVKPGGKLQIADFAPIMGQGVGGLIQKAYWYAPLTVSALLTGNAIHPIYDYADLLEASGMHILKKRTFRIFAIGPRWLYSITAQKTGPGNPK